MRPNNSAGFILIYVAVMLLALALILFELDRMRTPSPLFVEKQVAQTVQRREQQLLLDFLALGLHEQNLAADPRYLLFQLSLAFSKITKKPLVFAKRGHLAGFRLGGFGNDGG